MAEIRGSAPCMRHSRILGRHGGLEVGWASHPVRKWGQGFCLAVLASRVQALRRIPYTSPQNRYRGKIRVGSAQGADADVA